MVPPRWLPSIARILAVAVIVAAGGAPVRADEFAVMHQERMGSGLRLGIDGGTVRQLLGNPSKKGKLWERGSDGLYEQSWLFAGKGVTLRMTSETRKGKKIVDGIAIEPPCTLTTSRGIRIGSTAAEVEKAYASQKNVEDSSEDSYVAGSIYGGVIFKLAAGRVASIFIGAAAE